MLEHLSKLFTWLLAPVDEEPTRSMMIRHHWEEIKSIWKSYL